jgi:HEAT repeat protein
VSELAEIQDFLRSAASQNAVASVRELPRYRARLTVGLAAALSSADATERSRLQAWLDQLASKSDTSSDDSNSEDDEETAIALLPDFDVDVGQAALRVEDPLVRAEAANRLGRSQSAGALAPLLEALRDPDPAVRASAAQALGRLGLTDAVPALQLALDDPDPAVRGPVAYSLGLLHAARAIPDLIAATADASRGVRTAAGLALARIGRPAVAPLLRLYETGASQRAQLALRVMERDELLEPLLNALSSGTTSERATAAELLVRFSEPRVRAALQTALNDPDAGVRHSAGVALDVQRRQVSQSNGSAEPQAQP